MTNESLLEEAQSVMKTIRAAGLDCYIAGGYARDVYHGQQAKDIDVVVLLTGENRHVGVRMELYHTLKPDATFDEYHGHEQDTPEFVACAKVGNVDVLFYDCATIIDVVACFDCNLNGYVITLDRSIFIGEDEGFFKVIPRERHTSAERITYMRDKARSFGWSVN